MTVHVYVLGLAILILSHLAILILSILLMRTKDITFSLMQ